MPCQKVVARHMIWVFTGTSGGSSILVDQTGDGSAALDRSREIDQPARAVQRVSLAAGLVSPMTVVVPLVVGQQLLPGSP